MLQALSDNKMDEARAIYRSLQPELGHAQGRQ